MFRLRTITRSLFYAAAILVLLVFILHAFVPSSYYHSNDGHHQGYRQFHFFPSGWIASEKPTTTVFIPPRPLETEPMPSIRCREAQVTIEQYRSRSAIRGIIVRFPSERSEYFFVQFRWFYRSWIESEMFTLERWRTDIIIIVDDQFSKELRQSLTQLNCTEYNRRTTRRQISRCIVINHQTFSQRSESDRQFILRQYPIFSRLNEINDQIDRLFSIAEFIKQLNQSRTSLYDFLMITTMNTFITTQFGKYIPLKCAFLIGTSPDYSTCYGKTDQIYHFVQKLFLNLKDSNDTQSKFIIDYPSTIDQLKNKLLFVEKQVDIPCDSTKTTYRTSIYHIKCYAHSTSLFSERMFRENSYDGYEKQPFNIYIAREYAVLMALQSKVMSLKDLQLLAANVTHRDFNN